MKITKILLAAMLATTLCAPCLAQEPLKDLKPKVVRKIKIKNASPYLIWLILNGKTTFTTPPEPLPPTK